jgi:PKD repeat protein
MNIKRIILIILFSISLINSYSQTDTEFWFAVPEVSWRHNSSGGEPTYLHFASLGADAVVTIEMPKEPTFTTITVSIPANSTKLVDLTPYIRDATYDRDPNTGVINDIGNPDDNNILESGLPGESGLIKNKGIHITSTSLVTVYLERNNDHNPDIWALKGENAFGTEFIVPSQNFTYNGNLSGDPQAYNAIDIIAVEDVVFDVTLSADVLNVGGAGTTHTYTLLKGQSISLRAAGRSAADHLGGTYIVTNGKKIVVQWKDDSAHSDISGCYDLIGDQLVPIDLAGDEYIVMRGELANGNNSSEYAFIMAIEPNTTVEFNDDTGTSLADYTFSSRGEIHRVLLNGGLLGTGTDIDALHIKSTDGKSFIVFHVTGFGCEMGAAIVPTIKGCTGSTEVSFQRSTSEGFFLNIMCKNAHTNDFYINIPGAPANPYHFDQSWFDPIPGTNWSFLNKAHNEFSKPHGSMPEIPVGEVSKVYNTTGLFHLGLINGGGTSGCRYGYFSDFSNNYGSAEIAGSGSDYLKYCYQDTIQLQANGGISYNWEYASTPHIDTTFIDPQNISTTRVNAPSGFHTYKVTIQRPCYLGPDPDTTIPVGAYGYPKIKAIFDTTYVNPTCCSPFDIKYINNSVGANKYKWTFERVNDTLKNTITDPGTIHYENKTYSVKTVKTSLKASYTGNCPDVATKTIRVKPQITAKANKGSSSGCQQDVTVDFKADTVGAGPFTSIYWNWGDGSETEVLKSDNIIDFTHTFENLTNFDTTYYTTLVFIDSVNDCRDTANIDSVFVPGVARARYSISSRKGCSPLSVNIQNNTNGIVDFEWSFYDGNSATPTVDASYSFTDTTIIYHNTAQNTPKNFYVYLKITKINTDGSTCVDFMGPDTITVYPEFTTSISPAGPFQECNPFSVDFSETTTPNIPNLSYYWDFGDGTTYGESNPPEKTYSHIENTEQTYTTTLITTSEYNCTDTATPVEIHVRSFIDARFTIAPDTSGCSPYSVTINNNTSSNADVKSEKWTDNGTTFSPSSNPFNRDFINTTDIDVIHKIELINSNGFPACDKSFFKEITIHPEITAHFSKSGADTICNNTSIQFTNNSFFSATNKPINTTTPTAVFYWEFGDGTTSAIENPIKSFKNNTTSVKKYYTKLTLTVNGCQNVYNDSIIIYPELTAKMNTAKTFICAPDTVQINNTSIGGINFKWTFSDGSAEQNTSNLNPITYIINNNLPNDTINRHVYLTASNTTCSSMDTITFKIYPTIIPHINPDVTSGCGPLDINFSNQTTGGNNSSNKLLFKWDFDDGTTSNSTGTISHTFSNRTPADKPYTVTLTATNNVGCSATHDTIVTIFPEIEVDFTIKKNTECSPMPVFLEYSTLNGSSFEWDFGFDNKDTVTNNNNPFYYNFYHTNSNPNINDSYDIKLKVIDTNHPQCSDSITHPITIYPPVVADFDISDNPIGCSPLNSEFTNNSTGYKLTYVWDYNDGNGSANNNQKHNHIFDNLSSSNAIYNVKLLAIDTNGCTNVTYKSVTAYPKVVADFTFKKDINEKCTPYPVHFNYPQSALNGNKFNWDFGETNDTIDLDKKSFSHIYDNLTPNTINNYSITLISTDTITHCADTTSRTIEVYPKLITNFKTTNDIYEGCNALSLEFNNLSTGLGKYLWDFGDNQTSSDNNPKHTFSHYENNDKDFTVILTATQSATGCVKDTSKKITVYSYLNPKFGILQDNSSTKSGKTKQLLGGCTPFKIQLTDSSTCNNKWTWDFGDGTNAIDNSQPQTRKLEYLNNDNTVPLENKEYTIKLIVENQHNCTKTTSQTLEVYPRSTPDFSVDLTGCHPHTAKFINTSITNSNTQYYWILGDGATAVSKELTHLYYNNSFTNNKTFNVTLINTTSNLCMDSISKQITVYPKPLAAINPILDRGCSPLTTTLENTSKATGAIYYWDFDNGTPPFHTQQLTTEHPKYSNLTDNVEIKNVELIVESDHNCKDTVNQLINVYPEATAKFSYYDLSDTAGCSPLVVEFKNESTVTATSFKWDFNNGALSQLKNPVNRFVNETSDDHTFTVTLDVETPYGCKGHTEDKIDVYLSPSAEFFVDDPIKYYPDTVLKFQNLVKPGPWTFKWDYGNGETSNNSDKIHSHAYTGWGPKDQDFSYKVWLKSYSKHCTDSIWQLVTIHAPEPHINITDRNPVGCMPKEIHFKATYEFGQDNEIYWDFGDESSPVQDISPTHTYTDAGIYIVTATIKGDGGTFVDTTKVVVYPLPEPNFEFNPSFVMLPDQPIQFFNTTYLLNDHTYVWDFGDGKNSTEKKPWHQYTYEGLFDVKLTATSVHNCVDSITIHDAIEVSGEGYIKFPNAFLPSSQSSSDGSYPDPDIDNNIFHPIHKGVGKYELWIFNRWGEQVFYSNNILIGWNGRYGNTKDELGQDVYFWKSMGQFNNGVPFKQAGDVTLIRR